MTEPGAPWDASPLECTASGRKNKGKEAALAALCSPLPPHSTVDVKRSNRYRDPRAQTTAAVPPENAPRVPAPQDNRRRRYKPLRLLPSLNHLISDGEHARRNCKLERLSGLEIDDHLKLGWS
jgi:hypothetical protein